MNANEQDSRGKRRMHPYVRLAVLLGVFLGLTCVGLWWASPDWNVLASSWQQFLDLPRWTHVVLLAFAAGLVFAEMLRLWVMGRALGARVSFWAALDATIANNFFSWLSPGSALGEPAATYMLGRRGVPWDAAVLIAFGKFAISFAFIFGLAVVLVAAGFGPAISGWVVWPIAGALGFFALLLLVLIAGAFWPTRSVSLIDRMGRAASSTRIFPGPRATRVFTTICKNATSAVERLGQFRRAGIGHWMAILSTQALYHAVFIGVLTVLAFAFRTKSMTDTVPRAIIYQSFLYLAPTPGASGVGEASADTFFGSLLPGGSAFVVVILFRMLTYYLHVLIGIVYLPVVGGLREILEGRRATNQVDDEAELVAPDSGS